MAKVKQKAEDKQSLSEDDFTCTCCYEVLLDPTTLSCGHTVCRFCLANWWNTSKKAECLQCRRPFNEFPSVNFTLRNTIERLFPDRISERKKALKSNPKYSTILASFEKQAEGNRTQSTETERRGIGNIRCGTFCIVLSVLIALSVVIAIVTNMLFGGSNGLLRKKPVKEWTSDDVAYWVGEQGPWAKGVYDERFKKAGIDGQLLLKIRENDLIGPPINMNLGLHRRVFMYAVQMLYVQNMKGPRDLWSYKASNRAKSVFILFGLHQFPRGMIVYLYLFDYYEVFLPFLHQTCSKNQKEASSIDPIMTADLTPSWQQLWNFFTWLMMFPYYLIGLFAYNYLSVNYWIARIVIVQSFLMTGCELTQLGWLVTRRGYKTFPGLILRLATFISGCSLLLKVLSPFVPFFIYDVIFSWMIFIGPFEALHKLIKRLRKLREDQPQERNENDGRGGWQFNFQIRRE